MAANVYQIISIAIHVPYIVNTRGEAYVPIAEKFLVRFRGERLLVQLLPPKSAASPPQRTGRGRRLPTWTAALGRPLRLLVLLVSICKYFTDTLWITVDTRMEIRT